ncbi:hypothetical protein BN938_1144 [Mucinivorans hirudinis]|uniref:Uncharacterized protein n=1 Tax=Mucinivorans hirudinis TaxID=1433126 RepID=A0A060RCT1_9BACT|nr:hypothetical protein BN938_1144 [Mucinivorans hirudinis]
MATIRRAKKEIAYLVNEVISNSYMALYFQGNDSEDALVAVINKAVELHNNLIDRVNHPAEKNNRKLVRKHYRAVREDLINGVDELFGEISTICK